MALSRFKQIVIGIYLVSLPAAFFMAADNWFNHPSSSQPEQDNPSEFIKVSNRFEVSQEGIFNDHLAYGGKRGIYIIKDKLTDREIVGISGIGISELRQNTEMKTQAYYLPPLFNSIPHQSILTFPIVEEAEH